MLILALPKVHVENENKEFVDDIKRFCMIAYFEPFIKPHSKIQNLNYLPNQNSLYFPVKCLAIIACVYF